MRCLACVIECIMSSVVACLFDRMYYVVCGGFVCVIECIMSSVVALYV